MPNGVFLILIFFIHVLLRLVLLFVIFGFHSLSGYTFLAWYSLRFHVSIPYALFVYCFSYFVPFFCTGTWFGLISFSRLLGVLLFWFLFSCDWLIERSCIDWLRCSLNELWCCWLWWWFRCCWCWRGCCWSMLFSSRSCCCWCWLCATAWLFLKYVNIEI